MHSIRLRHPWHSETRGTRVCWSRAFHWPAGILPEERARLVIDGLPDLAVVAVNEASLAADVDGHFDVTRLLQPYNRLTIEVDGDSNGIAATACPFEVRLEVDSAPGVS